MTSLSERILSSIDRTFPHDSPRRKVLQILSIIIFIEGLSVIILFSYVGFVIGVVSVLIGLSLMVLLHRPPEPEPDAGQDSPGIRLIDFFFRLVGGDYVVMVLGASLILVVIVYNIYVSSRPEFGDSDTLSILFGAMLMIYPFAAPKMKVEASFAIIFLGFVVVFLVLPQIIMSLTAGGQATSSIGNWYVNYMLAAPFSGILDLLGVQSSSVGNLVTIAFHDGSIHTLEISAYCAGLYSFSIFISAFFAFVMVFERMSRRMLVSVLLFGLLIAYLGNLIRMVVIGLVGYYWGLDALHWTHENIGWLIFLAWSSLFWWLILGYTSRHSKGLPPHDTEAN